MFNIENNFIGYPDIMSVAQVREALQIGRNKIYELLNNNEIKSIKIGRDHKIPKQSVIDYLNNKITGMSDMVK